jgi:hypothetical protein
MNTIPTRTDYAAFVALFDQEHRLFLTDRMPITSEVRSVLELVSDACLAREKSILPDGSAVKLVNRLQVFAHTVPFVRLQAEDGVLLLPAYRFIRIPPPGIPRCKVCAAHTDARCSGCREPICLRHNAAPNWVFDLYCAECSSGRLTSARKEA